MLLGFAIAAPLLALSYFRCLSSFIRSTEKCTFGVESKAEGKEVEWQEEDEHGFYDSPNGFAWDLSIIAQRIHDLSIG
jgi:hypothetical protein